MRRQVLNALAEGEAFADDRGDGIVTLFHLAGLPERSSTSHVPKSAGPVGPRCQASAVIA
jgi:hypothetical protein